MLHRHRGRCDGLSGERVKPGAFLFMYQRLNVAHPAFWMCGPARHQAVGRKNALFDGALCSSAPAPSHLALNLDTSSLIIVLFACFWRAGRPILEGQGHTHCVSVHGILQGVHLSHGNIVIPVIFLELLAQAWILAAPPAGGPKCTIAHICTKKYMSGYEGIKKRQKGPFYPKRGGQSVSLEICIIFSSF